MAEKEKSKFDEEAKIKEAQEMLEKRKLAQDPANKEFWEEKVKVLEGNVKIFEGNLAETKFLIESYKKKVEEFG